MPHDVILSGCAPVPLAAYLKAFGVLRLVAEQKDQDARGWWGDERFVLRSALDEEDLKQFFLDEYWPTPIIAPWNGGSGFYYQEGKLKGKDPETGKRIKTGVRDQATEATKIVDAFLKSETPRLQSYREAIGVCTKILRRAGFEQAPKESEKVDLIMEIRGELADAFLPWLDAAVVLGGEKPNFPPLLGTGGNDGNLDFSSNFMQRLDVLFDLNNGSPKAEANRWLDDALFREVSPALLASKAIGQFSPGAAGGPNASAGFEADSLSNPWEFVLMLEGALLFAAAATRKLGNSGPGVLSYPFTVRKAGGHGGLSLEDEGDPRGEMWLPLWQMPAGYGELKVLFSEGRATLGRRAVRDGLDFARATARLGVNRGIHAFQRYSFQKRAGKTYLATPLNRVVVKRNPQSDLIDDLDRNGWLASFRRLAREKEAPTRLRVIGRRLDDSLLVMLQEDETSPQNIQAVLAVLGEAQAYLADTPKKREFLLPLRLLRQEWMRSADDKSHEFRLAAALAGLGAEEREAPAGEPPEEPDEQEETQVEEREASRWIPSSLPMRFHLAPLEHGKYRRDAWSESSRLFVWGGGGLIPNLLRVLERRLFEAERRGGEEKPFSGRPGADAAAIAAFLRRETDDARIAYLLRGLSWVHPLHSLGQRGDEDEDLPAAYAALKPIFSPENQLRRLRILAPDARLPVPPSLVRLIAGGRVQEALEIGLARTRASGLSSPFRRLRAGVLDGPRLAAALLIPVDDRALRLNLKRIYPEPVPVSGEEGDQR